MIGALPAVFEAWRRGILPRDLWTTVAFRSLFTWFGAVLLRWRGSKRLPYQSNREASSRLALIRSETQEAGTRNARRAPARKTLWLARATIRFLYEMVRRIPQTSSKVGGGSGWNPPSRFSQPNLLSAGGDGPPSFSAAS